MCIVSGAVNSVTKTNIYVSHNLSMTSQLTVYSNVVDTPEENTMILPVPNPDSIKFINLSSYPSFFVDIEKCFRSRPSRSYGGDTNLLGGLLPVFNVGSYTAGY